MLDGNSFEQPNDLTSMIDNMPEQTLPEDPQAYDPQWEASSQPHYVDPSEADEIDYPAPVEDAGTEAEAEVVSDEPALPDDEAQLVDTTQPEDKAEQPEEEAQPETEDLEVNHALYETDTDSQTDYDETTEPVDTSSDETADETTTEETVYDEGNNDGEVVLEDTDPWANYVDDGVYGNHYAWTNDWYWQGETQLCGPTSVSFILNQFFGAGIFDPTILANQALELGLVDNFDYGTPVPIIQELMTINGVDSTLSYADPNDPMLDLATKLEEGRGVLAVVDSHEIWAQFYPDSAAIVDYDTDVPNHALIVTEININTGQVTLSDPGTPDGNALQVSIDTFANAWGDSGFQMLSTNGVNDELRDPTLTPAGGEFVIVNASGQDNI